MAIRVSRQRTEVLAKEDGNVRVSRQRVEVLNKETGNVRVSRVRVEVLVPDSQIYEKSATSTLSLGQSAVREALTFERSSTSTLSLGQSTGRTLTASYAAASVLELTQSESHSPKFPTAFSTLELIQEVGFPGVYELSATSILTLTDIAVNSGLISASASSTLELVQYADDETKARDASNTLTLTDTASVDKILQAFSELELTQVARTAKEFSVESVLSLTQSARQKVIKLYGTSQIEFSQSTHTSPQYLYASNTLELTQSNIVTKPIRVSATSELTTFESVWDVDQFVLVSTGLRDEATLLADVQYAASSVIGITHEASAHVALATGISASASSQINWTQKAIPEAIEESVTSTLVLSQTAFGVAGKPGVSVLSLTGVAAATIDRGLASVSTLGLQQSTTYTLILGSTRCQYSPFVGDSSDPDAPTPPPAEINEPLAGIQVPFQLVYPAMGAVTDSVSLKAPNLGNKDRLAFNRVLQETRGGTLIVFADPIWPKIQTLVLTFSGLYRVEAHNLLAFIEDYLGKEIGLIDWEHRYWKGIITTPDEPIIEDKFDNFTASFSFEGELDPTWSPQVVPPSLRYSAIRSEQEDGYYVPNEPILPDLPESIMYYTAITDNLTKVGNPLYLTGVGHVNLARADAEGTTQVVGLAQADYTVGQACNYITEGRIERTDWTIIAGTTDLSIGATYFLDPNTAGHITTMAPTTAGQFVVRVGRAVDARTLDIEIELPILL